MPTVNPIRPNFISDLTRIKAKTLTGITQSQYIFDESIFVAGQAGNTPAVQYANIYDILDARDLVHQTILASGLTEDVSVTGKVTELICQIALQAVVPNRFDRLPKTWDWVGDFAILGSPFNLFISVKSYKAKERLIVSGMGQNAAPVIGYGLFDDATEWSPDRVKQYKQRGFVAIYMPVALYNQLATMNPTTLGLTPRQRRKYTASNGYPATNITNIYDKPLLRKLEDFSTDVANVCPAGSWSLDLSKF